MKLNDAVKTTFDRFSTVHYQSSQRSCKLLKRITVDIFLHIVVSRYILRVVFVQFKQIRNRF